MIDNSMTEKDILEALCREVHARYEEACQRERWTSQVGCVPWSKVPRANKRVMRHAVAVTADIIYRLRAENERLLTSHEQYRENAAASAKRIAELEAALKEQHQ